MKTKQIKNGINMMSEIDTCLRKKQPFSIHTKGELDYFLIDALSKNVFNEVHLYLNTMNENKFNRLNNGECSTPTDLINSIIDCFNEGIYTILSIEINRNVTMLDIYQVLNRVMNWIPCVELIFDNSYSVREKEEIRNKISRFLTGTKSKLIQVGEEK